ncbi:hypothetical protein BegalDRAFT_3400 [Beggiatoa alba B18LD]|uniref:Lipid/polyisoprenoid-binding YceI-like domain-containing protein n=1 Tax=Beggiatoa alba B18LD TaxID=395493 RepID=I3CKS5_9GAMM|nr:YceI family protein [Beggiatoa alba]EIJ44218.1 hypothetical protein BegalDRAFT_3400 [Beggiatoa alba B18LD]
MMMKKCFLLLLLGASSLSPWAHALEYNAVVAKDSKIDFVYTQMNVPVEGIFKAFDAQIQFDPAKPESTSAKIDIDLNSIDLGSDEANTEVKRKPWFNLAVFPKATFSSQSVKSLGNDRYEVTGELDIKGKKQAVVLPVVVKQLDAKVEFSGQFVLKRLQFNIGEGAWSDTETVADDVTIKFSVIATAKP